ncbi:MAG: beta-lactamase family protein [Treponema sp.]|jgi:CubicO group peptidase (beta-lactamase class C family)|nr:beta-lactamase family protein [Treponema sp.]
METDIKGSGFCPKRLGNTDAYLRRLVDTGQVSGAGALISRRGRTAYRKAFGMRDMRNRLPMEEDTIFRIYSMTKTFTVAAAMTLYEQGLFKLQEPIAGYLPAYKDMHVAEHDERGIVNLVPAKNPMSFEHLFTMSSGIPYPGSESFSSRALSAILERFSKAGGATTAEIVDAAARAPLCFHPGERWIYGFSHDVLGRLVEVISGKRLGEYMEETVFLPLGLKDTAFCVPEEKQGRLARAYQLTEKGLMEIHSLATDPGEYREAPAFESGGGGLASTLDDVGRYGNLLLNFGKLDGYRLLSRKTIELIRKEHVNPAHIRAFGFAAQRGYGYGLGVRSMTDIAAAGLNGSYGEWGWDGMLGTFFCVDPEEELVAVFMIQRIPGSLEDLARRFLQTVYGAIDD